MKNTFDFHSRLTGNGENLTRSAHFLPVKKTQMSGMDGLFAAKMTHLPEFGGVFNFYAEKLTMAQPLLKGELR